MHISKHHIYTHQRTFSHAHLSHAHRTQVHIGIGPQVAGNGGLGASISIGGPLGNYPSIVMFRVIAATLILASYLRFLLLRAFSATLDAIQVVSLWELTSLRQE